jgi:hypothetical protein
MRPPAIVRVLLATAAIGASVASVRAGVIAGTVSDAEGSPVAGTCVIVCDAGTGIPVATPGYRRVGADEDAVEEDIERIAFLRTDAQGRFRFEGVPAGEYRLVAQSWLRAEPVAEISAVNGSEITLHGVADRVVIEGESESTVDIRPLGDLTLQVSVKSANSDTLMMVSPRPLRADPILGFAGWGGPFCANWVAINRMPLGKTTIRGLPPGTVHIGLFANDNNPGWAGASAELRPGTETKVWLHFVASWSDGLQSPPPELTRLIARLMVNDIRSPGRVTQMLADDGVEVPKSQHFIGIMGFMGEHADRELTLPDGSTHRAGDVLAAAAYIMMREQIEKQGRTPNLYKAPVVERRPIL